MHTSSQQTRYDIFISYRRDGGFESANLIALKLTNDGYRVFFDLESLRSGKFNEKLHAVIEECSDFVLILPKDGLNRCHNEDDWVRQEIVHAMKSGKNIIPVLLRDFQWPDSAQLPKELQGLNNYNAIAAGSIEHFEASFARLRKFLVSKTVRRSPKWPRWVAIAMLALAALAGGSYLGLRQLALPVCVEQVASMSLKLSKVDGLVMTMNELGKSWREYFEKYTNTPAARRELNADMRERLNYTRKTLLSEQPGKEKLQLNASQHFFLNIRGVNIAELEAFHNAFCNEIFETALKDIDLLERFLNFDEVPKLSLDSSDMNVKSAQFVANAIYYDYMGILSKMPPDSRKTFYDNSPSWRYFSQDKFQIGFELKATEYEHRIKNEMEKLNQLVNEVAFMTTQQMRELEKAEKEFARKKEAAEKQTAERQEAERKRIAEEQKQQETEAKKAVAQTLLNIQKLTADVFTRQRQLQDYETKIEVSFRNIIEKDKLTPEDGQARAWGKITRVATQMARTSARRRAMEAENAEKRVTAKEKGYDVSAGFEVKYTLTMDEVLKIVHERLDEYGTRFSAGRGYVPAVKKYYEDVKNGVRPIGGMLVMSTKDNVTHPLYKVGDIVLSRKGWPVNTTTEYNSAGKNEGADVVTFLRLNGLNNLKPFEKNLPQSEVLVGFLPLKYE